MATFRKVNHASKQFSLLVFGLFVFVLLDVFSDRSCSKDLNPRNEDKINVFENRRKLSQPLDVVEGGQQSDGGNVEDLENPSCKEADHADGVHTVALLNDRRLKNVDRDSVVMISNVAKENYVGRHFNYGEE